MKDGVILFHGKGAAASACRDGPLPRGVTPTAAASPGRQALRLTFTVARAHVVGADIGRRSVAVAVAVAVAVDREKLQELHPQWRLHVENDASLAALAEMGSGDVEEGSTFLTLLSGERLGAGLVLEGSLHRGAHGAAGEMDYLEQVVGVGGSLGIAEFSTSVSKGVRRDLADIVTTPPRVVLSTLGRDVVLLGALKSASDVVRGLALQDEL